MRKIIVQSFITLDGVMQAPGGPDEDASSGFKGLYINRQPGYAKWCDFHQLQASR